MLLFWKLSEFFALPWAYPRKWQTAHVSVTILAAEAFPFFACVTIDARISFLALIYIYIYISTTGSALGNAIFTALCKLPRIERIAFPCSLLRGSLWSEVLLNAFALRFLAFANVFSRIISKGCILLWKQWLMYSFIDSRGWIDTPHLHWWNHLLFWSLSYSSNPTFTRLCQSAYSSILSLLCNILTSLQKSTCCACFICWRLSLYASIVVPQFRIVRRCHPSTMSWHFLRSQWVVGL